MDTSLTDRPNARWLDELRGETPDSGAVQDLGVFLRRGLAKALGGQRDVRDSDLDDFTQDAIMRVLKGLDTFRGDSRFTTWAMAVAVRAAFSALRRRRFGDRSLDDLELGLARPSADAEVAKGHPGRRAERADLLEALGHAIQQALTERQRIVIMGELAGVPTEALVERLDTNPNALYKLHHDARKKLRAALNAAGFSDEDVRQELARASEDS